MINIRCHQSIQMILVFSGASQKAFLKESFRTVPHGPQQNLSWKHAENMPKTEPAIFSLSLTHLCYPVSVADISLDPGAQTGISGKSLNTSSCPLP